MGLLPRFFLVQNFATFRLVAQICKMYKRKIQEKCGPIAIVKWMVMTILPFFRAQGVLGCNLS
jgi:hypothetical protein